MQKKVILLSLCISCFNFVRSRQQIALKNSAMVTVGQHIYNSLILLVYKYLTANIPNIPTATNIRHPDEGLNIKEQIVKHGYHFEEHNLQTADGYILTLFRLLPSSSNTTNLSYPNPSVLFIHGILSSAQDFISAGPSVSIAYKMADSGYDVWLGNCRGNTWSRKHVTYKPDDPKFWQFSFHEIGYYDLPAKLDYITNVTGHESVYYIGHSQGTTSMMVMASEQPEYIRKVRLFVALAPVAFPKNMPAIFGQLGVVFYKYFEWLVYTFEYFDLLPHEETLTKVLRMISERNSPFSGLFKSCLYSLFGYTNDIDLKLLPVLVGHLPAGSSTRQFLHYFQNMISDSFRKYDYGPQINMKMYGKSKPPRYNLSTKMPTALIYSNSDWLSTEDDVERIASEMKQLKLKYRLPGPCSHMDYLYGRKTTQLLGELLKQLFMEN